MPWLSASESAPCATPGSTQRPGQAARQRAIILWDDPITLRGAKTRPRKKDGPRWRPVKQDWDYSPDAKGEKSVWTSRNDARNFGRCTPSRISDHDPDRGGERSPGPQILGGVETGPAGAARFCPGRRPLLRTEAHYSYRQSQPPSPHPRPPMRTRRPRGVQAPRAQRLEER